MEAHECPSASEQRWEYLWPERPIIPRMTLEKFVIKPLELFPWCSWALLWWTRFKYRSSEQSLQTKEDKRTYTNTLQQPSAVPSWWRIINIIIVNQHGNAASLPFSFQLTHKPKVTNSQLEVHLDKTVTWKCASHVPRTDFCWGKFFLLGALAEKGEKQLFSGFLFKCSKGLNMKFKKYYGETGDVGTSLRSNGSLSILTS